jgi:hypothetical protein
MNGFGLPTGVAVVWACSLMVISGCAMWGKAEPLGGVAVRAPNNGAICFLEGAPPTDIKYEVLGRTMRSYGSTDELRTAMAREARKLGADAVINFQANQGLKGPWRVTSLTGDGTAIKVTSESPKLNCLEVGGKLA